MSGIALTRRGFCKLIGFSCLCGSLLTPHRVLPDVKKIFLKQKGGGSMQLPDPATDGDVSLEMTIPSKKNCQILS